jgi:hypothetical protein
VSSSPKTHGARELASLLGAAAFLLAACGARTPLLSEDGVASADAAVPTDGSPTPLPDAAIPTDAPAQPDAPPPTKLRIALFGASGSPAYDSSALVNFLQAYPATVTRTQVDGEPLTSDVLASFDVIILDRLLRTYTADEASAMQAWVKQGGGLLSLTGFYNSPDPDVTRPNSLLAPLGGQYLSQLFATQGTDTITDFVPGPVTTGIQMLPFAGGYGCQVEPPWTTYAFDADIPVGMFEDYGNGRVDMWGDEWVEYSMEWPSSDAQVFWQNAIDWLLHRR